MNKKTLIAQAGSLAVLLFLHAEAGHTEEVALQDFSKMLTQGEVSFDFRYRFEYVDQNGIDRNAGASTLRSRLTYQSAKLQGFSLAAEFDNVTAVGSERYNSTENGNTGYPVVADPTGTDFNRVQIDYTTGDFAGTYGRQRILHSGQRFVGGVAWRQNEQTYDGLRLAWKPMATLKLDYSYIYNVNRIFGPDDGANPADLHGANHLVYFNFALAEEHKLSAFAYLLDFDDQHDFTAGKTVDNSSDTYGLEYHGVFSGVKLHAAYATQSDAGENSRSYDADYYMIDLSAPLAGMSLKAGFEVLGAGDGVGFATPLATLHKFQGWTDVFLTTPGAGIEDIYAGASGELGPLKLQLIYHDFSAEDNSDSYGSEINLAATWLFGKGFSTQLSYAHYNADDFGADTTKVWLTLQFKI